MFFQQQDLLKLLLPYLKIKHDIAERFIDALETFPKERANHAAGERTWDVKKALKVAEIALNLNPTTNNRFRTATKDPAELLLLIKKAYDETQRN